MNSVLEETLVKKYPELCIDYQGDMSRTCFAFGFEHGDGWYRLVDEALGKIQSISSKVGLGVKIAQIKSKFGQLRLYVDFDQGASGAIIQQAISQINDVIDCAERESCFVCERSGDKKVK